MSFMVPEVYETGFYLIETTAGTECLPFDIIGTIETAGEALDYLEGTPIETDEPLELRLGWVSRLSAPGYIDCTTWSWHETELDALESLIDDYDDVPEDEEDDSFDWVRERIAEIRSAK